jgi:hypothetical protein
VALAGEVFYKEEEGELRESDAENIEESGGVLRLFGLRM